MKNRISVYVGPPLGRLLENEKNVSGRLNEVADRYQAIIKKEALDLTDCEAFLVRAACNGTDVDPIMIEYFEDEISDLDDSPCKSSLIKKLKSATFSQKLATIEQCCRLRKAADERI